MLFKHIDLMKAGLTIAYPGNHGLPDWETVLCLLQDKSDMMQTAFEF